MTLDRCAAAFFLFIYPLITSVLCPNIWSLKIALYSMYSSLSTCKEDRTEQHSLYSVENVKNWEHAILAFGQMEGLLLTFSFEVPQKKREYLSILFSTP